MIVRGVGHILTMCANDYICTNNSGNCCILEAQITTLLDNIHEGTLSRKDQILFFCDRLCEDIFKDILSTDVLDEIIFSIKENE